MRALGHSPPPPPPPDPGPPVGGVLLGGEAESRTLCAFMSDFSLSSVYLTVSLFVLPHGTSKPIASGTVIPKIFAVRFSAALFFLLKILLVGAINKFRISSKFVIISGISVAEIAELGSGISVSGSMALSAIG